MQKLNEIKYLGLKLEKKKTLKNNKNKINNN